MSKQREALEIALEVLDSKHNFQSAEWRHMHYKAFQIIREALAEPINPVQEAAPDLLEALEQLLHRAHPAYVRDDFMREKLITAREIARAAIAKAIGEV